jgi:hypothetical protein
MLAHHHAMKTRDNMSAVIEGLQRQHGLLAAYLEAIAETARPVKVVPSTSTIVFRHAGCEHY